MNNSTRRQLLRFCGVTGMVGFTGCLGGIKTGSDSVTETPGIEDTDGDGVIDSEDYAPRDPEVQREEQLKQDRSTPTETSTDTPTERQSPVIFEDRFETGSLEAWEDILLNDPRNQNRSNWRVTSNSITGSYSAYSETNGDKNLLISKNPIIESDDPFQITFQWRTSSSDSRGIFLLITDGNIIDDGKNISSSISVQLRFQADGSSFIRVNGDRQDDISVAKVGKNHRTKLVIDQRTVTVEFADSSASVSKPLMSGEKHLGFNSSGYYGSPSDIWIDNIKIRKV